MKTTRIITVLFIAALTTQAFAGPTTTTFTLTPSALGLPGSKINYDDTVDADTLDGGFVTSETAGEGSVLTIQQDGTAGPGSESNRRIATVTASTHLDNINPVADGTDYRAGIITLTGDETNKSGLGVRAFTVDNALDRTFDTGKGGNDRAVIEGSKEISGGTDDPLRVVNRAPHVDESVTFDFDSAFQVNASSIDVMFEKWNFDDAGRIALDIDFTNRDSLSFNETLLNPLLTSDTSIFSQQASGVWTLDFAGLTGLGMNDYANSFTIRMLNDYKDGVLDPSTTAQHGLINGVTFTYDTPATVPAPGAILLASIGASIVSRIRRRRTI